LKVVKVRLKKLFISRLMFVICAKLCRFVQSCAALSLFALSLAAGLDPSTVDDLSWYVSISTVLSIGHFRKASPGWRSSDSIGQQTGLSIPKTNGMVGQDQEIIKKYSRSDADDIPNHVESPRLNGRCRRNMFSIAAHDMSAVD